MTPSVHYTHSGKAPLSGILLTLGGGAIGGALLGAIYGFLIYFSPFVYINFLITLGFGFGLAMLVGSLGKLGKIRNFKRLTIIALLVTALAYYVHWSIWIGRMTDVQTFDPGQLWNLLKVIALLGPWSIFGWTPSGGALWAIWAMEAIVVIGLGVVLAHSVVDLPFCENTGQWAEEQDLPRRFQAVDPAQTIDSPQQFLDALKPLEQASNIYAQVSIATVAGSDLRCASLKSVAVEVKDDTEQSKDSELVRYMLFDQRNFDQLLAVARSASC